MQLLGAVSVTRPWHWGISVISDPSLGGEIPAVEPDARVSANEYGIVMLVRHAQDQGETFDDGFEWAQATVTVRHHSAAPAADSDKASIFEGVISTPTGRLWIGDADENTQMTGFSKKSVVRVLTLPDDLDSPDQVWVDVWDA